MARTFLSKFLLAFCFVYAAEAQDVFYNPQGEQIPGPACQSVPQWFSGKARTCTAEEYSAWLADVRHWRDERKIRIGLDSSEYARPALAWTQSSFIQPQMMVHDRYFYDPAKQKYTVDAYLDDLMKRYGGIDSVLIWPTYPNIGVDDRNQYDLFHDLPGGVDGIRKMVADFHRHGVRVLFPVMVWDQGTRSEGIPDAQAISEELVEVGADGINGDTLDGAPRTFREASDKLGHPLALEPEGGVGFEEMINYNNLTWGYWKYDFAPSVSRYKWLEPRHMVNICNRWARDHADDIQAAFFNGTGFESWENVWGYWNQLTPRDAETVRRTATIERAYSDLLVSADWEPHTPTQYFGVFASKWPGAGRTLWTVVNRNGYSVSGGQLRVPFTPGAHFYDLWHGEELSPVSDGRIATLSFPMEARGFGAILQATTLEPKDKALLATMKALAATPLNSYSNQWTVLPQHLVEIAATTPADSAPPGMARIPEGTFVFRVNGIEIEGMDDEGVDVQYPWEPSARRYHEHSIEVHSFWIDKYPVTNAEFKKFMDASHYEPSDSHNFLRAWRDGTYPEGWGNKPVTWVSLEDARAYAKWAGKRLPHEWEWQYAAQGTDGRKYPWGQANLPLNCPTNMQPGLPSSPPTGYSLAGGCDSKKDFVPIPDRGRIMQPASDVDAHPEGVSPFGVMDLVGNVWQWTDEYQDEHTRAAVLRGGSHYQPQGARWYFPQAYELSEHGKYLLMAPSLDRSGTIGFRCVKDGK
jgi:formylglycine-generating enzyme required for sulfatase activity